MGELQGYIRTGDDRVRQFATAALGKSSPEAFASMLPELLAAPDPIVRKLALQMAEPDRFTPVQLEAASLDGDGWVRAAAAAADATRKDGWPPPERPRRALWHSTAVADRAAAGLAAALVA